MSPLPSKKSSRKFSAIEIFVFVSSTIYLKISLIFRPISTRFETFENVIEKACAVAKAEPTFRGTLC